MPLDEKIIDTLINYMSKYPILIMVLRNFNSAYEIINFYDSSEYKLSKPNQVRSNETLKETAELVLVLWVQLFSSSEELIQKKEIKIEYQYPVYNFNLQKILKHSKKMDNESKYIYITYILKEYPNHLVRRYNIFIDKWNEFIKLHNHHLDNYFRAVKYELETDSDLYKKMGILVMPKTLEEVLQNEIQYLEKISEYKRLNKTTETDYQKVNEDYTTKILAIAQDMPVSTNSNIENKLEIQHNSEKVKKEESELLTISEVMKMFKISRTTLTNWRKKGLIEYNKIGRNIYFEKSAILEMLKKSKRLNNWD